MRSALLFCVVPLLLAACLLTGATAGPSGDVGATMRARQWPLQAMEVREAWRITRGSGVTVAVLDTGVDDRHPDLKGAIVRGPDLTGTATGRKRGSCGAGPDAVRQTPHVSSGEHGTAMAALIAGRGHGPSDTHGILGVAPEVRILSIKVTLDDDAPRTGGTRDVCHDAVARGIRYAVDHGAQVISMSLGGGRGSYRGSAVEERAVRYALSHQVVLIASSGNDGAGANQRNFPAAYPGVIAVGAVDRAGRPASFSNRQDYLSLVAPGTEIVSAQGRGSYVMADGTSSAAALVAGVAALIRSRYPDLSAQQVRRALQRGAVERPRGGHDDVYGAGMANARRALEAAGRL
ncbi:S8 family serine peptidase [Microtetraspora sp. NBRC 16547]|uniref:S8 family serine peptidase n=1 Tax=Microtetraspora sp. NBRC 16547 TaxID=3030993 RepID=UPI0024A175A3|nr:S8 family serine peptidase [Microtetraspora sp. NBRC 16547]GLW97441.1 type VII secretion-associated serine protease [Microtetraspora sp. NBRC 16547]